MMNALSVPRANKLWVYALLPPVILNVGALLIYGGYYGLKYTQPEAVAGISESAVTLASYGMIAVVEWLFALGVILWLRRHHLPLWALLKPEGDALPLRGAPALAMGAGINLLFVVYFLVAAHLYGDFGAAYRGLPTWARVFHVLLLPFTAAFCEELIWRGHILTQLTLRGYGAWKAILLMSLSFALIHGVFLVDKLAVTFLVGLITGWYYRRERNLLPVMAAHWFLDVWGYGIFLFGLF